MEAKTAQLISKLLSAGGLLWCLLVSCWISVAVPVEASHRFAEISRLGGLPLVVPVLLAALATWGAWRNKTLLLLLSTAALLAFCFLAGFSIGLGYLVGGGAMLWALLVQFDAEPEKKSNVPIRDDAT